jgi:Zn-finger nucleic acid-binding protein
MNCPNCGATMELVAGRRYFRCTHCGSYGFPEGPDAEGIRVIGTVADSLRCPVCEVAMSRALLDDVHPVDFCNTCRGVLMPRDTFAGVINARRAWASTPPSAPVPFDRAELRRVLTCPKCGGRFQTYPHYGPGNVVIDSCTTCDLIWLDFGEMRKIVDAPGRDRGSQRVPRIDEAFVRHGAPRSEQDEEDDEGGRHRKRDVLGLLLDFWVGR